ncbi:MAG TPA: DNA-binding response regulator [Cryomorphaceae bacterium]|mgnify:CR=1 FL=1|nr:DNA-binding response regulator [Owenweeksia sp.]MBF97822.1 DNA-binding response regulator [Owenweeksia sp.]HAD96635.1 DNA-binding response regulator [Cryomorphaceae bacterium]HBF21511.1 DNA-binding response regulator [Cryomorphaceae bacterium]HCQ15513.1 DNA-binding response regulator [Cryomorphaceae bacterium]|tara:strand:- start:4897 stop:5670 length:774 start_codon:yes stop_codon:yes gene_type:complete
MPEPYKTLIIEDEEPARERLKRLLAHTDDVKLIGEAGDGEEGLKLIEGLRPDLVFLDIEMPVYNAFEMLNRVKHMPLIIFITAYDQFALKAFEENSVDYLLKPVEEERLHKALGKLQSLKARGEGGASWKKQLQDMLLQLKKPQKVNALSVQKGEVIRLVRTADITHLEAEDKYVCIYDIGGEKHLTGHSLAGLKEQLGEAFLQIHRSCIINTDHITEISKSFKGRLHFTLGGKAGKKWTVSSGVTYSKALREHFNI